MLVIFGLFQDQTLNFQAACTRLIAMACSHTKSFPRSNSLFDSDGKVGLSFKKEVLSIKNRKLRF